jgi:preprotein translocase subunit SecA
VEARNAEIRKNVLKYDEVLNEQRKVIYRRRDEVLDGVDLRTETTEALASVVDELLSTHCEGDYSEQWDLEALLADTASYWPTSITPGDLGDAASSDELYDRIMADAMTHYEGREAEFGEENMRLIERQVMLRVIDARWREHLKEMDHLQDGINLRALGQKDPLSEWQREGFDMFGQLMSTIEREYVQYVMRVQRAQEPARPALNPQRFDYTAPEDPSSPAAGRTPVPAGARAAGEAAAAAAPDRVEPDQPTPQQPVVKSEWDKTPRNAPCPCGSGKKFKLCHGA